MDPCLFGCLIVIRNLLQFEQANGNLNKHVETRDYPT